MKNETLELNTTIIKNAGFISCYLIDGREVNRMRIFDKSGILFETSAGWFERKEYPNRIQAFMLPKCPVRKLKENLTVSYPYYLSDKDAPSYEKSRVILYIPAEMVSFKNTGEIVLFDFEDRTSYSNSCEITLHAQCQEYVKDENSLDGFKYIEDEFKTITIQQHTRITREELKQLGKDIAHLEGQFKQLGIKVNQYEVEQILKNFTVTKKPF